MSAAEYQAKAEQMRALAARETSSTVRAEYEQMARGWEAMARRRAAQEALQPPVKDEPS
jgi:hypothetical protein